MPSSSGTTAVEPSGHKSDAEATGDLDAGDNDEYEIEYEEIEEEIEVEEEVEVKENVDNGEIGVALIPVDHMDQQIGQFTKNQKDGASLHNEGESCSEKNVLLVGESYNPILNIDICSKIAVDQTPREDIKQVPMRRCSRTLSSDVEYNGSKRQGIICDFFAKGWCVKGSSCKFIHKMDHVTVFSPCKEGSLDVANTKTNLPDPEVSLSVRNALESDGKVPGKKSEMEPPLRKDNSLVTSPNIRRDSFIRGPSMDDYRHYSSHMTNDSLVCWTSSSTASENYRNMRVSSHTASLDVSTRNISQFGPHNYSLSIPHTSSYKPSLPSRHPSCSSGPVDSRKLLDDNQNYCGSKLAVLKKGSSFFGHSENISQSNALSDMQQSISSKRKISFDWEPSAPFMPSFYITQRLLSPVSLYDPIRDSIEQTCSGNGHAESSYSGIGTSKLASEHLNDNMVSNVVGSEFNFNKYPDSDHSFHVIDSIKTFPTKDSYKTVQLEDKWLNSDHARDCKEGDDNRRNCDPELQSDGSGHLAEVRAESSGQNTKADLSTYVQKNWLNDSRSLKNFHAALVEFLKELLRPTWHEGVISKDAHKIIIKRSVDKVIGSLQPDQIPSTSESVTHYLNASKTKLAKLIEGYVDRYRQS